MSAFRPALGSLGPPGGCAVRTHEQCMGGAQAAQPPPEQSKKDLAPEMVWGHLCGPREALVHTVCMQTVRKTASGRSSSLLLHAVVWIYKYTTTTYNTQPPSCEGRAAFFSPNQVSSQEAHKTANDSEIWFIRLGFLISQDFTRTRGGGVVLYARRGFACQEILMEEGNSSAQSI